MAVINFETAGTFSTSIKNPFSGATGLIQFMPATASSLGTSTTQLAAMSFTEQLDFVEKYYRPYKQRIRGFVDLYLATFFPAAIGKPDSWVLSAPGISASKIAEQNPVFAESGVVRVGKIKSVLLSKVPLAYAKYLVGQSSFFLSVLAVGGIVLWLASRRKPK
ncbi:hypothetical protein RB2501_13979 [Robiginitalea biformata HTCC2501]|uniref:Transglycosylase SLT domain-containing protein n=2 Tax=Robiginitalea TaxID=252306 RepID=A4CKP3_ROBBH|nr:hypothetical protein RB2501_13979 [Robiginitalea biformata HTCC2501]